jgi:hypothetical protein
LVPGKNVSFYRGAGHGKNKMSRMPKVAFNAINSKKMQKKMPKNSKNAKKSNKCQKKCKNLTTKCT